MIAKGENTIKCFNELSTNDIILLGKELTILQSESVSGKEEKCRECNTEGGHSFFYKKVTNPDGKKEFIRKEISIKIEKSSANRYIYIDIH